MTIIAVDVRAGLMVADTQVGDDDGVSDYHTAKIARAIDGSLVGASGDNVVCLSWMRWAKAGCKGSPKVDAAGFMGVRLTPGRELQVWLNSSTGDVALNRVLSLGSGRIAFEAAYQAGASIEEAVRIACALTPTCGLPLTVLRLEGGE